MSRVLKILFALGLFGLAGFLVYEFMVKPGVRPAPKAPTRTAQDGSRLPPDVLSQLKGAADLVAPDVFRNALLRFTGTPAEKEVKQLLAARADEVFDTGVARPVEDYLNRYRYKTAVEHVQRYVVAWQGLTVAKRMRALIDDIRKEQQEQVDSRKAEAEALLAAGRYEAAREALSSSIELEEHFRDLLEEIRDTIERRIRVAQHNATAPARIAPTQRSGSPESARATLAAPPPLPGFPHPDVKRLREARALLAKARSLFRNRRYQPAAKALADVVGFFGDLIYVSRQAHAVGAMNALARHGAKGVAGLFNASKADLRGQTVKLVYTFKNADEYLDWEQLPTIPHKDPGEFKPGRSGVRGDGVMSYLHRGFFKNDVVIRCEVTPNKSKTQGLMFAQAGLETRQLMWVVTNHWLVEGENYVKERPGHSILMFGKGVNNDVPVDSPEIGFIFRGASITSPQPKSGESFKISFSLRKDTMTGEIKCRDGKGSRGGAATGDDGRGIERVRPGLIVIQNTVVFRDIEIEGKLHPDFEKQRVAELLDLASTLD